jgi:2-keto-4-pentenoate hydratase/2-oxohepta-3-ene-1,7-dioic acid hydratase in catechol pathway
LIAHGETIILPGDVTEKVEYEAELVAVIGKKAKNITEAEAVDCLLGFTIGNDLSERSWQKEDRTLWRAKNTDTFSPMGPWIDTDAKLEEMETIVKVNGEEKIRFETDNMMFSVQHYLSTISKYIELQPGDVLWMGTEGDSQNLSHGDVVDIEITGIGTLTNPIVKES